MLAGCVFLDANRRNEFRGPQWDVPFAVPLFSKQTRYLTDLFEFDVDDDGTLGFRHTLDEVQFRVPPGWTGSNYVTEPRVLEIDVEDLPKADELGFVDVVLSLRIKNESGFRGTLSLQIDGISDGDVAEVKERDISLGRTAPVQINLTNVLNAKPDKLRLTWSATLQAGTTPIQAGKLSIAPEVWVPLAFHIGPEGQSFAFGEALPLGLGEDDRRTLREAPIGDVGVVMEVDTRLPFGVELIAHFGTDPEGEEGATVRLNVPPADTDATGRALAAARHTVELLIDEEVREAIVRPDATLTTTVVLVGPKDNGQLRLTDEDYLSFRGYGILTAIVNKGGGK